MPILFHSSHFRGLSGESRDNARGHVTQKSLWSPGQFSLCPHSDLRPMRISLGNEGMALMLNTSSPRLSALLLSAVRDCAAKSGDASRRIPQQVLPHVRFRGVACSVGLEPQ